MELTECPYDATEITAGTFSGGSLMLSCTTCEAAWEWHGAWVRRVREPDREKLRAARNGTRQSTSVPAT